MVYITPTFPPQCHCDAGSGKSCDPAKECKQGMQLPGIRKTVCITDTYTMHILYSIHTCRY